MTATADIPSKNAFEQGFLLGELRIDPQDGEVTGPGGAEQLDPKVMNVLLLLAEHAGHIVSREDLLSRLWPNAVVTDDVLSRCIYELRRQLSQAGADEQLRAIIETVPKRGYRLNGEVTSLPSPSDADSPRRPRRALLAVAALAAVAIIVWLAVGRSPGGVESQPDPATAVLTAASIAVLPFLDMSAGQDQGYLADGITEEILNRLTRAGNLRVISRTSSFAFRGKPVDIREVAEQLDVSHVLEGSIRRSGNTVRITAQLIAASDNAHVWSDTFDRELGDLFAIQDEIAASVASSLQIQLATSAAAERPPASAAAYEMYLQGRFFHNRRAPGDSRRAMTHFQQAVELDPHYAVAWAALAGTYPVAADEGEMSWDEAHKAHLAAAERAVRIEPELADGHYQMAQYYLDEGDRAAGRSSLVKAHALDPLSSPEDDPFARPYDDLDKAIRDGQEGLARDPLSAVAHMNHALVLFAAGRLDEAKIHIVKTLELSPDMGPNAEIEMVRILVAQRQYAEARARTLQLPDDGMRDHGLALLFDSPEYRAEADAALDRLKKSPKDEMMHCIRLAEVYALRGMPEPAFGALARFTSTLDAADKRTTSKRWWMQHELGVSPFLKPVHADPRWSELMTLVD
jgi:TolB-like protein/DNA-binding winged helix-turn-helix (wHTH) protein/tetratricopeptide (TPR) repeat protein